MIDYTGNTTQYAAQSSPTVELRGSFNCLKALWNVSFAGTYIFSLVLAVNKHVYVCMQALGRACARLSGSTS